MNKIVKNRIKMLFISIFFGFVNLFSLTAPVQNAYAEPADSDNTSVGQQIVNILDGEETTTSTSGSSDQEVPTKDLCKEGLDNISWLLCPKTEKGADAVDWLYEKVEDILEINPIAGESGDIVMKIWEICRGITNIVFVLLFLLIVISQVTGFGITNYGIKRALPKLIIAAIAVNLSFYICNYAVDLSNTIGISIRNLFSGIEAGVAGTPGVYNLSELTNKFADYYDNLANFSASSIAAGGIILETGVIFMLIPAILVALVAVLSGFITIALRQVVVVLCVMIAPLAIVAIVFPNTFNLFRKWRHTLTSMLVFFPMFSLLFGASSLAGFAVIKAAGQDGFMQLVGMIIQLAPLILCWKMMKMSGTVLGGVYGTVNGVLTGVFVNPARRYASSLAAHRRARTLAQVNPYTPSARLMQYMENRRISREIDIAEYSMYAKQRAAAFNANKKYKLDKNGRIKQITKEGEEAYEMQAKTMKHQQEILRDKNAMNQGLGTLKDLEYTDCAQKSRLSSLDLANVQAADALFNEQVHSNDIAYRNAVSRAERYDRAINAHIDQRHANEVGHRPHNFNAPTRYQEMFNIMGSNEGVYYAAAAATSVAESQKSLRQGQYQKFFDSTVPTQDVVNRLKELTTSADASNNMDAIISGMRTLYRRGDGKLLKAAVDDLMSDAKIEVGTAASQTLANFLIAEVKDTDPALRRFGKYINLETARYYNTDKVASGKERKRRSIDYNEYVLDGYDYVDEDGVLQHDKPKMNMTQLIMGTKFAGVEREAFLNILESVDTAVKSTNLNSHEQNELKKKLNHNIYVATLANTVGDQFSYASGSEQINGFARSVTGMKIVGYKDGNVEKPIYDWDDDMLALFSSDKEEAKEIAFKRCNQLLAAEVPTQAAKQKTDVLYAMREVYKRKAAEEFVKAENSNLYKEWRAEEKKLADDYGIIPDENKIPNDPNKTDEENRLDFEQNRFAHYLYRSQFKDSVRGSIAKQLARGFQGDAKENTHEQLGYNDYVDKKLIAAEITDYSPNAGTRLKKINRDAEQQQNSQQSQQNNQQPQSQSQSQSQSQNPYVEKMAQAIARAFYSVEEERSPNPQRFREEVESYDYDDEEDLDGVLIGGEPWELDGYHDCCNIFDQSTGSLSDRVQSVLDYCDDKRITQDQYEQIRELQEAADNTFMSPSEVKDLFGQIFGK